MLRGCEYEHLQKHGYVHTMDGNICLSKELWSKLLENQDNQNILKSFGKTDK